VATTASPTASPVASRPTTSPTASPSLTTDFGFFAGVEQATAPVRLKWDRATFLTGEAANKAAAAHGDETPVPNDYYIVNDNPKLRVLVLASTVDVFGSIALNEDAGDAGVELKRRTVAELLHFLKRTDSRSTGFHLRLDAAGRVTRVEEQYVP
jgi:hypothetical protein